MAINGAFRYFLRRFGWGGAGHVELHGLGEDVPEYLNLVQVTLSERTEMHPRLRASLLPVWNDGGGNLYCLDTDPALREPHVVIWDHERGEDQQPDKVADDFMSWLLEELKQEPE